MLRARFNYKATQGCMKYVGRRVPPVAEINRVGGRSRQTHLLLTIFIGAALRAFPPGEVYP